MQIPRYNKPLTDEEYLNLLTDKQIYAEILLGILRYVPVKFTFAYDEVTYKEELKKKLKFNHVDDPELLRASIDLLEDTESAILEFCKNGLGTENEYHRLNLGEGYLRLYGILNAVYLQVNAITELITIFNLSNKKDKLKELTEHKIYKIRNIVGAHTTNFLIDHAKKGTRENTLFFRVTQISLNKYPNEIIIIPSKGESSEINLVELVDSYNKLSSDILKELCNKSVYSIFANKSKNRDWLEFRLKFTESRKQI